MKRTFLTVLLALVMAFCLTACGCEHVWEEATCTAPKTCRECGETEGEVIAHEWEEATCTAPKTCRQCGLTEGDTKEHILTEANYQTGEHCVDCGEVLGEPIVSEFDRTGRGYQTVGLTDAHGKTYEYTTAVNNGTQGTTGEVLVSWAVPMDPTVGDNATAIDSYVPEGILPEVIAIDHLQSLMENVEGYKWRGIEAIVKFPGQRNMIWGYEDFYTLAQYDENAIMETFRDGNTDGMVIASLFSVDMDGETYDKCQMVSIVLDFKTEVGIATFYRVPENYDGCVFSLIDSRILANSDYSSENTDNGFTSYENVGHGEGDIYFRLK